MTKESKLESDIYKMENEERLITEQSEMGAVMESLDDSNNRNLNTRLTDFEIGSLLSSEGLDDCELFGEWFTLPKKFKEMKVSLNGLGREEKVRIMAAAQEQKTGTGFLKGFTGLFQKRQ